MQIKIGEKTTEIKFGNLNYFIILLQYNIRKEAGCHLFLRMKRSGHKKRPRNHCEVFPK